MPRYVFKHDPNIGSLYFPFYQYFVGKWNETDIPEYDLETDELIYRDKAGNEVRREKFEGAKTEDLSNTNSSNHDILQNGGGREEVFSPWWPDENRVLPGDFPPAWRQNFHGGLHPGGKEFSLLRSKNPICETAGWIALL
jgi:hypothetical protein